MLLRTRGRWARVSGAVDVNLRVTFQQRPTCAEMCQEKIFHVKKKIKLKGEK